VINSDFIFLCVSFAFNKRKLQFPLFLNLFYALYNSRDYFLYPEGIKCNFSYTDLLFQLSTMNKFVLFFLFFHFHHIHFILYLTFGLCNFCCCGFPKTVAVAFLFRCGTRPGNSCNCSLNVMQL